VTHAVDFEQRHVGLLFTVQSCILDPSTGWSSAVLNVTAPASGYSAPPGYYMLFVTTGSGVPSVARFVQVL
jgi:hypothetical protein